MVATSGDGSRSLSFLGAVRVSDKPKKSSYIVDVSLQKVSMDMSFKIYCDHLFLDTRGPYICSLLRGLLARLEAAGVGLGSWSWATIPARVPIARYHPRKYQSHHETDYRMIFTALLCSILPLLSIFLMAAAGTR